MTRLFWHKIGRLVLLLAVALFAVQCDSDASGNDDWNLQNNNANGPNGDQCACLIAYPTEDLSTVEMEALQFMREEEKLARDVYLRLHQQWNMQVFANIAKSEQRHMDAMKCLLDKYELADPAEGKVSGEFTNADLAALYTQLVEDGLESLEAAYRVGATIEDLDIYDLRRISAEMDNGDILAAFGELERGSRNHLRAFTRSMNGLDASYAPAYLTKTEYGLIIDSPHERGSALCGTCAGNGTGNANGPANRGNRNGNCSANCNGTGNGPGNGQGNGNGPGNGSCRGGS